MKSRRSRSAIVASVSEVPANDAGVDGQREVSGDRVVTGQGVVGNRTRIEDELATESQAGPSA